MYVLLYDIVFLCSSHDYEGQRMVIGKKVAKFITKEILYNNCEVLFKSSHKYMIIQVQFDDPNVSVLYKEDLYLHDQVIYTLKHTLLQSSVF